MRLKQKEIILIFLLVGLIFVLNYSTLDSWIKKSLSENSFIHVDDVIDGDTIKSNGTSIRLLGINSPEKGEKYSEEAKKFLEDNILNKTVRLEYGKDKTDRYGRTLAYLFFNGENVNLNEVKEGLANYYFPSGKDFHYSDFKEKWENCIRENKNLCEKSEGVCSECIQMENFNHENQEVVLKNICNFDCNLNNWDIKDEGRKHFKFQDISIKGKSNIKIKVGEGENNFNTLYWTGQKYVWTKTGDTLFLRDSEGKLVLWDSY